MFITLTAPSFLSDYFIPIVLVRHQKYTHSNLALSSVYMAYTISHWDSFKFTVFCHYNHEVFIWHDTAVHAPSSSSSINFNLCCRSHFIFHSYQWNSLISRYNVQEQYSCHPEIAWVAVHCPYVKAQWKYRCMLPVYALLLRILFHSLDLPTVWLANSNVIQ